MQPLPFKYQSSQITYNTVRLWPRNGENITGVFHDALSAQICISSITGLEAPSKVRWALSEPIVSSAQNNDITKVEAEAEFEITSGDRRLQNSDSNHEQILLMIQSPKCII